MNESQLNKSQLNKKPLNKKGGPEPASQLFALLRGVERRLQTRRGVRLAGPPLLCAAICGAVATLSQRLVPGINSIADAALALTIAFAIAALVSFLVGARASADPTLTRAAHAVDEKAKTHDLLLSGKDLARQPPAEKSARLWSVAIVRAAEKAAVRFDETALFPLRVPPAVAWAAMISLVALALQVWVKPAATPAAGLSASALAVAGEPAQEKEQPEQAGGKTDAEIDPRLLELLELGDAINSSAKTPAALAISTVTKGEGSMRAGGLSEQQLAELEQQLGNLEAFDGTPAPDGESALATVRREKTEGTAEGSQAERAAGDEGQGRLGETDPASVDSTGQDPNAPVKAVDVPLNPTGKARASGAAQAAAALAQQAAAGQQADAQKAMAMAGGGDASGPQGLGSEALLGEATESAVTLEWALVRASEEALAHHQPLQEEEMKASEAQRSKLRIDRSRSVNSGADASALENEGLDPLYRSLLSRYFAVDALPKSPGDRP